MCICMYVYIYIYICIYIYIYVLNRSPWTDASARLPFVCGADRSPRPAVHSGI